MSNKTAAERSGNVGQAEVDASVVEALSGLLKMRLSNEAIQFTDGPDIWKPHPPNDECPVCLVPLPFEQEFATYWSCCGKSVCRACDVQSNRARHILNRKREKEDHPGLPHACAFRRKPTHETDSELIERLKYRICKGDAQAMINLAAKYESGTNGLERDDVKTIELVQRAADSGFPHAIASLGRRFLFECRGTGRDLGRALKYLENAAKKGDVDSRFFLGELCQLYEQESLA